ncbi:Asparagine synthase (glutamine-hydrolyzing) [Pragia fontium]|uniref:asparagine synthase-related protein n=1 Tax=Pragia fontium TaxID=82985 RepID=UPI000DFDE278|nr:asparagine synthase-related protein [Pragia fontium]SUB83913.1 Asparagine synthase (glutamine-hydrolyzing) [Pragia fontium]
MIIINPLNIASSEASIQSMGLIIKSDAIFNESLTTRLYLCYFNNDIIISENVSELVDKIDAEIDRDAAEFYIRYGFIFPPFTLYKNIFLMSAYTGFSLSKPLETSTILPEKPLPAEESRNYSANVQDDLITSLEKNSGKYNVLFSAGVDSSVLLGMAIQLDKAENAINCFMSSMPEESHKAKKMCELKEIPIQTISVRHDLENQANEFLNITSEPISDKIALVIPTIINDLNLDKSLFILDGQGADSLFSGLPHDKLYNLYHKKLVRLIARPFSILPIWENKKTRAGRLLYRITKVLKCLSSTSDEELLAHSLVEESDKKISSNNKILQQFYSEINILKKELKDFHLVIRYIFMFRILPAREMQKYILSQQQGYQFKLPFLETDFIKRHFYISSHQSIIDNIYKYPMTKLAKHYWPGFFKDSKTSPFQVDFNTGSLGIKELSLNHISIKTKSPL